MSGVYCNGIILITGSTDTYTSVVNPEYIYTASLLFFSLTAVLVLATFYTLRLKNKKKVFKNSIQGTLEQWITDIIINESSAGVTIPEDLAQLFKNREARQIIIDELVRHRSSFLGSVADSIVRLYYQLGFNVDSRLKLYDSRPHVQCQGIHELCVMEQKNELQKVYRLTNSEDKDVRIESQTAILRWYGFTGLRFLDVVSSPITEFQQLKLLEQLRQLPFAEMPKLSKWLQSKNDTVVSFALKLGEHYKQVQVIREAEECLFHENEEVRVQAVKTLATIGNSSTARLLTLAYEKERFTNRLNILKELPKIASDEQRDFLIVQLHEAHEYLKVAAAKVLAKCTTDGMEILEAKSYFEPAPYRDIYLQIKSEAAR